MARKAELADWKNNAKIEFESWAGSYDRSVLNKILFNRCYLKVVEILLREYPDLIGRIDPDCDRREAVLQKDALRLLDIGCGTGSLLLMVSKTGLPVWAVGLDMAEQMCRVSYDKAKMLGYGNLCFVRGDSEHLPFEDASFDLISCLNSFHHYPRQGRVLREMNRVLKPGGRLILMDGYVDNIIGWFVFDVCVSLVEKSVHHCSIRRMSRRLRAAGFADFTFEKMGFWAPVLVVVARKSQEKEG